MPHINDGTLHAYLDGALPLPGMMSVEEVEGHAASCEACRNALEEERALRARAGVVLGQANLEIHRPEFAAIQASAARRRTHRVVRMRRIQGLAAAAVLVTVVGVSAVLRDRGDAPAPAVTAIATRAADEQSTAAAASQPADRATEPTAGASEATQATAPARAPTPPTVALRAPEPVGSDSDRAAEAVTADRLDVAATGAGDVVQPAAPMLRPAPEREMAARMREQAAVRTGDRGEAPIEIIWQDLVGSVSGFASAESKAGRVAAEVAPATEATAWRPATPDSAAQHLGQPVPIVPGATVVAYEVGTIGAAAAVRVGQRLPDGTPIALVVWSALTMEGLAEAVTERTAGSGMVVVFGRGLGVMASGRLPAEELEQLAGAALRSGG